jgi:hypothetical protein
MVGIFVIANCRCSNPYCRKGFRFSEQLEQVAGGENYGIIGACFRFRVQRSSAIPSPHKWITALMFSGKSVRGGVGSRVPMNYLTGNR